MQGGSKHWVLKSMRHRGKGLQVAVADDVLDIVMRSERTSTPVVVAQTLLNRQLLLDGLPFYIR